MSDLTAIVLAGGYSSRFYPYSSSGHKTMIKIMGKPILEYTLLGLKAMGIREIILRVSEDKIIENYFRNGSKFGLRIKYIVQKEVLGIGDVLLKAKKYLKEDFILISANHVDSKELVKELLKSKKGKSKGVVIARKRENTWDYGVAEVKNGKLVRIVEKPKKGKEPSKLCIVIAFLLSPEIINILEKIKMSEYNFENEALELFAKNNPVDVAVVEESLTLKYPWDLLDTKNFLLEKASPYISNRAKISKSAEVDNNVVIEEGSEIFEGAKIKGPAYIGRDVKVGTNALIRSGSDLEDGVSIGAFTEIKNSILMDGTTIHSGFVGDSIIGSKCKIGSRFTTANRRIDRGYIGVTVKGKKVDTGLTSFGTIIGNNVKIGIRVSTMPGVVIGNNVLIGPSTSVFKNIEDDVTYYTKFAEVIEKK